MSALTCLVPNRNHPTFYMTENKAGQPCLSGGGLRKLKASPTKEGVEKIASSGNEVIVTAGDTIAMREETGAYLVELARSFDIDITAIPLSPREECERIVQSSPIPPCAFRPIKMVGDEQPRGRIAVVLAIGASTLHVATVTPDLNMPAHCAIGVHDVKGALYHIKMMLSVLGIDTIIVCGCPTYTKDLPFGSGLSPESVAYSEGWAALPLSELVAMMQNPDTGLALSGPGGPARSVLEALDLSHRLGLLSH